MTNYFNFVETIKRLSMNHGIVNETGEGDIYLHLNSGTHKYPCVFLTVQNITKRNDTLNVNGTLFYVDKMLDNSANKTEIQSNAITILSQVIDKISEDSVYEMNAGTYTPFEEKFSDLCAGAFVSFTCTFPDEIVCSDSEYKIKTITLTSNGVYDIVGYDKAIVEVCSEAQWGDITGDIENQQDLIDLVDSAKYDDTQIYSDLSAETSERISEDERLEEKIDSNKSDIDALGEYTFDEVVPTTTNFQEDETWGLKAFQQRVADLNAGQSNINSEVNTKLGNCTAQNPAADRGFVNSSIASAAANFRGNWTDWSSVPTDASQYPADYTGSHTPTKNDYIVVGEASGYSASNEGQWRFAYTGEWSVNGKNGWIPQYKVGSTFTAAQQAALDSGINSIKVNKYEGYESTLSNLSANKVDKINTANKIYGTNANSQQVSYEAGENITFSQVVESGVTKYKINASSTHDTMYIEYGDDDNVVEKLRYAVQNNILPIVHFYDGVEFADFYVPLTYIYLDGEETYHFCAKVDYDAFTYYSSESMLAIWYYANEDEWNNEYFNDVIPVIYNQTTHSELSRYMQAVNCIFVYEFTHNGNYYYQFVKEENNTYYFNRVDGNKIITASIGSDDVWHKTVTTLKKVTKPLIVSRAIPLGSVKEGFNFKMMWGNRYLINLNGGIFFRVRNLPDIADYIQDKIDSVADILLYKHPVGSQVIIQDDKGNDAIVTDYVRQSQSVVPNDWNGKIIYTVGEINSWEDLVDEFLENLFYENTGRITFLNDYFASETAAPGITVEHCTIQCHRPLALKEIRYKKLLDGYSLPYRKALPPFANLDGDDVPMDEYNANANAIVTTESESYRVVTWIKRRGLHKHSYRNGTSHHTPGILKKQKSHFVRLKSYSESITSRSNLYKYSYIWRKRKISDKAYYAHGNSLMRIFDSVGGGFARGTIGMHLC